MIKYPGAESAIGTFATSTNVRYAVRFRGERTSAAIAEHSRIFCAEHRSCVDRHGSRG
jgi:hypothetical protein